MKHELPPILAKSELLIVQASAAVRGWSKDHKYGLGAELRKDARDVFRFANRAWRDQARRDQWLEKLEWHIDELKCSLRVGKHDQAFQSTGQFKVLITLADELGRFLILPFSFIISNHDQAHSWPNPTGQRTPLPHLWRVAGNEAPLLRSQGSAFQPVRWTRHQGLRPLAVVQQFSCGHGRASGRNNTGSDQQRFQLRPGKLPLGDAQGELAESLGQQTSHLWGEDSDACGMGRSDRTQSRHLAGPRPHGLGGRRDNLHSLACALIKSSPDDQGREQASGSMVSGARLESANRSTSPVEARHDACGSARLLSAPSLAQCEAKQSLQSGAPSRVVGHARDKFSEWGRAHVRPGSIAATPDAYRRFQATSASYLDGHFKHAATHKLRADFHKRFPWLAAASMRRRFHHLNENQLITTGY